MIEVVEAQEHIDRLIEILDEMMQGGLVTLEKVRAVRYAPGKRQQTMAFQNLSSLGLRHGGGDIIADESFDQAIGSSRVP